MDQLNPQHDFAEKLDLKEIKKEFPKAYKKISCPSCKEEVGALNIELHNCLAKCENCNVIFSIEDEAASVKTKKEMKQTVLRPEGIDLFYFKDDLEISILQPFMGAFNGLGIMLSLLIAIFALLFYFTDTISIYYVILSLLGFFYFIYRGSQYTKNKTYIDINKRFLSIKHRPKNLNKDKHYPVDEIDQLYLKRSATGYYTIYMQANTIEGQKHEKLISVKTLSKARYLEQEIEKYLNIENKEVQEATV